MANMDVTQRNQFDRAELSAPDTSVRTRSPRGLILFTLLSLPLLGVLAYAAAAGIDGWAHAVVLAGIVLTTVGAMIAIDPLRRG